MVPGEKSGMEVTAQCTSTGKYIRILMPAEKIHGQKVRFHCPYCKEFVIGNVEDMNKPRFVVFEEIRNASDPYFHYSFYFKASFRGKRLNNFSTIHQYFKFIFHTTPFYHKTHAISICKHPRFSSLLHQFFQCLNNPLPVLCRFHKSRKYIGL